MDKQTFIYLLIEAVIFLIPVATLFIKLGGYKKMLEDIDDRTKSYPEWKATANEKIASLELSYIQQSNTLAEMNKNIIAISTKMDLLLDNKLTITEER